LSESEVIFAPHLNPAPVIALSDGLELAYDDVGTGIPLVLVHGFPHNRGLWAPQVNALVDRARCLAPDLRGLGESMASAPYSMDQYADDLAALMDVAKAERAVIAGLSMGGYVAFAFWRRHRDRVRALVLADTKAGADSPEGKEKRKHMIFMARERGSEAVADAMIAGMVGKSTREKSPEIVDFMHAMMVSAPVDGVVGALQAMMDRPDSTPTLATIDVPVLIVVGDEDALTPVKESEAMHAAITGSRLEVLTGAGHVSNVERPAAFNHVLSEFLSSLTLA
jgi:pimeloyl-ACP methyl ester carboxylesterase